MTHIEDIVTGKSRWTVMQGDCLQVLPQLPADSVNLVFGSPPYMDARTYGIGAVYDCQQWVDWMLKVTQAAIRVSTGLVLWVAAGVQRDLCYWPACEGLMWEWWKRGNQLWRPCVWWKVDNEEGGTAIPGSGGKQYLRNDWEYVIAFKREGWLPWADPLVMGHEPIYAGLGGKMSNRYADGRRANERNGGLERRQAEWAASGNVSAADTCSTGRRGSSDGGREKGGRKKFGANRQADGSYKKTKMMYTRGKDGERYSETEEYYGPPKIANPGNCIIVKARVGGGHMGSRLCHENEAPFPEALGEFFVRSFCPPGGIVLDPFAGSGTTLAVAVQHGRRGIGIDIRQSQIELTRRRMAGVTLPLFAE